MRSGARRLHGGRAERRERDADLLRERLPLRRRLVGRGGLRRRAGAGRWSWRARWGLVGPPGDRGGCGSRMRNGTATDCARSCATDTPVLAPSARTAAESCGTYVSVRARYDIRAVQALPGHAVRPSFLGGPRLPGVIIARSRATVPTMSASALDPSACCWETTHARRVSRVGIREPARARETGRRTEITVYRGLSIGVGWRIYFPSWDEYGETTRCDTGCQRDWMWF